MVLDVGSFDIGLVEIVEVVDDGDLFGVAREQSIDKVRPDKAGAARYQKSFTSLHRSTDANPNAMRFVTRPSAEELAQLSAATSCSGSTFGVRRSKNL